MTRPRYPALDGLRGLAALVVSVHHHLLVLPTLYPYPQQASGWVAWVMYTPLHLLWAGSEAVILFFVLSGFVLSLPVWNGHPLQMRPFLVRRIWRIWVPLMVAVTLAWAAAAVVGPVQVAGASPWFNHIWEQSGSTAYLQHALMLGDMDQFNHAFAPVVWSLKWEMWASLLLPLIVLWARQHTAIVLATATLLIAIYWHFTVPNPLSGLLHYLPMFALGALLARQRALAVRSAEQYPYALLLLSACLIPAGWYNYDSEATASWLSLYDYATLIGCAALIALALGWPRFRLWLERPGVQWLGRISFSLYLYHALVLTVVVRLGHDVWQLPTLLLLSFGLGFPVAHVAYQWVERPAMRRGKSK